MEKGIVICGLNGCGKSTLGRALAKELGLPYIDSEDLFFTRTEDSAPYANACTRAEAEAKLREAVKGKGPFVFAAVRGDYGKETEARYQYAVYIEVPAEIRRDRLRSRSFRKFGKRMLPGGDLYESEEQFFQKAALRTEAYVVDWLRSLNCKVIRVDGTKPVEKNISSPLCGRIETICEQLQIEYF